MLRLLECRPVHKPAIMLGMLPILFAGYAVGVSGLLCEIAIMVVVTLPLALSIRLAVCIGMIRPDFATRSARSFLLRCSVVEFFGHFSLGLMARHCAHWIQSILAAFWLGLGGKSGRWRTFRPSARDHQALRSSDRKSRAQHIAPRSYGKRQCDIQVRDRSKVQAHSVSRPKRCSRASIRVRSPAARLPCD